MENSALSYLYALAERDGLPFNINFELTPVCNMNCAMCYIRRSAQEVEQLGGVMPAEKWLELAQQAKEAGALVLIITGGEPFMYPHFRYLYERLQQMGFLISLNTNGTLLDESTIEWLRGFQPDKINITLYGASDETYAKLCGKADGFTRVSKAIDTLLERNFNVYLNCVMTKYNAHELEAMFDFAKARGLVLHVSTYMFPPVRKCKQARENPGRLSAQQAAEVSVLYEFLQGEEAFAMRADSLLSAIENTKPAVEKKGEPSACRAGKCSLWVKWNGEMTPCGMMESPSANPFELGFLGAWERIKQEVSKFVLPAECTGCKYRKLCYICAACSKGETGDVGTVPPYACELAKNTAGVLKNRRLQLDKQD